MMNFFSDSTKKKPMQKTRQNNWKKKDVSEKIYDVCLKTVFHIFRMIELQKKITNKSVRHFISVDPVTKIKKYLFNKQKKMLTAIDI